ncbi:MAG: hypothetical protein AAB645_00065 [Patescibacteria group bacterium]
MDLLTYLNNPFFGTLYILGKTFVWWGPFVTVYLAWGLYMAYIHARYISRVPRVLLEIKMPKEIFKSPQAMEVVLSTMYQTTKGNLIEEYIKGKLRSWFSLEIVSFGGDVHFYIWTERKLKNAIESTIYSQYPGVEVYEVDDYTNKVPYGLPGSDWDFWGVEWKFSKEDFYPIKTYVDYGLDKDPKEEFKVDPLTAVLEYMASIGPGEQVWYQLIIMASYARYHKPGTLFKKEDWTARGKREVDKMMHRESKTTDLGTAFTKTILSPGEKNTVEAIERSFTKLGFDTGFRCFYLFPKGQDILKATRIPHLLSSIKQYGSGNLNSFKLGPWTDFDYPWQDWGGRRLKLLKWRFFDNYRRRSYFNLPANKKPLVLNTEEIATMFHFPGQVATTPTLERVSSKRGEPPPNLPVG